MTTVSELMTKKVSYVRTDESLSAAAKKMWDGDCGAVPVIEAGGERVVGMITDRDICIATWSRNAAPSAISISEVMSSDPLYSAGPDDPISSVKDLMRNQQIRRLPVLDHERKLVGIVSLADIAAKAERIGAQSAEEVVTTAVAETLAGISRPHANREASASA